jgi:hypothetical protein
MTYLTMMLAATLYARIREILGSNPGHVTGYLD